MSKQDANRFDREDRRGAARRTYPTQGGPRVGRVQTNVPRAERYDDDFGAKKPYGKKDFGDRPYGGKKSFDERKPYGKPADDFGAKKPYGKPADDFGAKKPYGKKDFGDRPYAGKRDFDERKPADDFGTKKPYGKKDFGDRPYGGKKDFGDRPYGGKRDFDDRKPYGKPADDFGAKKPYGKKDFGDRPYAGKRDFDERKPYGKPADDFGAKKPYGGKKDFGDRPYAGKRDFDERKPYGKPADDFGAKKPYGGKKDFDERPHGRDFGDRPYGGDRYYDGDPKRRREERGPRPALPPRAEPAPAEPELSVEETAEMEHMLCGRNPIREALRAGRTVEKLLAANGDLSGSAREIIQMAREAGAVVQMVDRSRLDAIYPSHQGLIAYVSPIEYSTVEKMLAIAQERGEEPFLILLDGITDPHNLGAIIRTAECVGAHGVIVPERRSAGLTPAAAKAAAGALNHMPIARVTNLNRTIDELKEKGVWIIGAAMDGESAFTCDLTGPAALVIGSEGDGISRLTMEKCDRRVSLPMKGHLDSLNASVAAGVLMYEIARARAK